MSRPRTSSSMHSREALPDAGASLQQGRSQGICGLVGLDWLRVSAGGNVAGLACIPGAGV